MSDTPADDLRNEHIYPKATSHDGKKVMSEKEAAEVVLNKPWFKHYKCEYCTGFHLTKEMNPRLWYKKHQEEITKQAIANLLQRLMAESDYYITSYTDGEEHTEAIPVSVVNAELKKVTEE